jgi:hypothetical protein
MIAHSNDITEGVTPRSDDVTDWQRLRLAGLLHGLPSGTAGIANAESGSGGRMLESSFRFRAGHAHGVCHPRFGKPFNLFRVATPTGMPDQRGRQENRY